MLTPDEIAALRDRAERLADPVCEALIADLAKRITEAGQLTSTAQMEVWKLQNFGYSQADIRKLLGDILGKTDDEIARLLTQAAEVGYRFDLDRLPTADAIPFEDNAAMQDIVSAAVRLAQEDFQNFTRTLGMVDPYGRALPLQEAYRHCVDFAFEQVATGAADYNTAIRQATRNLAARGLQTIDYESGRHQSVEAAVRTSLMTGLGRMQEEISKRVYEDCGCDGWEISAHAASAPDHEPIQGKQYSNADYQALNDSLVRRIGTLNCGHSAFPIILGVDAPVHSPEELEQYRQRNEAGVTYNGKHYTMYEATQRQRLLERSIRAQKRKVLVDESTGDREQLETDQIRLQLMNQEYRRFNADTGLRSQRERAQVAGFGQKQAQAAVRGSERAYQDWAKSMGVNNSIETLAKYYDVKYTNSPRYALLQRYSEDVKSGWISPLVGFDGYERMYNRIQSEIVGRRTSNGILITGQSRHFTQRVVGTMIDPKKFRNDLQIIRRSGVEVDDIIDALFAPGASIRTYTRRDGAKSMRFKTTSCMVTVNPDTGNLIQVNLSRGVDDD